MLGRVLWATRRGAWSQHSSSLIQLSLFLPGGGEGPTCRHLYFLCASTMFGIVDVGYAAMLGEVFRHAPCSQMPFSELSASTQGSFGLIRIPVLLGGPSIVIISRCPARPPRGGVGFASLRIDLRWCPNSKYALLRCRDRLAQATGLPIRAEHSSGTARQELRLRRICAIDGSRGLTVDQASS